MASKVTMPNQSKLDANFQIFANNSSIMFFRLFKSQVWVDDDTVYADLVEADYAGYNKQDRSATAALGAGPGSVAGDTALLGPFVLNFPDCSSGSQQIYGVMLTYVGFDAADHLFMASNCFDDESGIDVNPPVGVLVNTSNPPPPIVWINYLWDFFQPTP